MIEEVETYSIFTGFDSSFTMSHFDAFLSPLPSGCVQNGLSLHTWANLWSLTGPFSMLSRRVCLRVTPSELLQYETAPAHRTSTFRSSAGNIQILVLISTLRFFYTLLFLRLFGPLHLTTLCQYPALVNT
jgi:hypothetical protein